MDFKAGNAIAKIPYASALVRRDRFIAALDIGQHPGALSDRDNGIFAVNRHIVGIFALFLVKRTIANLFQEFRYRLTLSLQPIDEILVAQLIKLFERAIFPRIAGLHGRIDGDDVVRDLSD